MKEKAKLEEEKKDEEKEDPKGIPEFWLTVFKNVDLLSDMLQVAESESSAKWVRWVFKRIGVYLHLVAAVGSTTTKSKITIKRLTLHFLRDGIKSTDEQIASYRKQRAKEVSQLSKCTALVKWLQIRQQNCSCGKVTWSYYHETTVER